MHFNHPSIVQVVHVEISTHVENSFDSRWINKKYQRSIKCKSQSKCITGSFPFNLSFVTMKMGFNFKPFSSQDVRKSFVMLTRRFRGRQVISVFAAHRDALHFSTMMENGNDSLKSLRKVKVALVGGYLGTGYCGVQLQDKNDDDGSGGGEIPTIEAEVRSALFKAGCIRASNMESLSKIGWSRSSRTDKGVHASCIVV
jgi:hypothetical protein